ncbi:magnesium transporter [Acinetobacter sp. NCu2D-2]|uniref:magnesium transporter n=1 Tax=Acinetobacter sp. NCu2D-2 TaxID=1608473 RepID=UPI0007CDD9D1|nr:magnesium transporter [Acinetobacter sp. NCu2D-2]ANF82234.1 magnesium transporter [Acinetobacter sp. NCu2D-2]
MLNLNQQIQYIQKHLKCNELEDIAVLLGQMNMADQASLIQQFHPDEQLTLFRLLIHPADVLEFMPLDQQHDLITRLHEYEIAQILDAMHSDDLIDLFNTFSMTLQQALLAQLSLASRKKLELLSIYPESTAGSLMSSDYVTLSPELNMNEAIEALRQLAHHQDTLYLIYIVDAAEQLMGVISLRQIIQAEPNARIRDVMTTDVIHACVEDDQEDVARLLAHYDFIALPITDQHKRLLGIVTYDDAMDIFEQEGTEDFLKAGAIAPFEKQSIKTVPIFSLYRNRVFWLVILVFGSLLSSFGIAKYEDIIEQNIVLVFFLPLLVGSGGNAGSQSATLMVRALATGDVELKDWFRLIGRETLVALCLGITMAVAVSILGYIRGDEMVALVLAISMTSIVLLGCLIGMSLPFILNQLKLDPASASSPLVTSICDATGVVVYLFVASQLIF